MSVAILCHDHVGMGLARLLIAHSSIEVAGVYTYVARAPISPQEIEGLKGRKGREHSAWIELHEKAVTELTQVRPKVFLALATTANGKALTAGGYTLAVMSPRTADVKLSEKWLSNSTYTPEDVRWLTDELASLVRTVSRSVREWPDLLDLFTVLGSETGEVGRLQGLERDVLSPLFTPEEKGKEQNNITGSEQPVVSTLAEGEPVLEDKEATT